MTGQAIAGASGEEGEGEEGSSPARTVSFTTSFDVTVVDQPILTHPKMASISGGQLEYLKAFMDGARLWELVPEVDNAGKPKLDSDGLPVMKQLGKLLNTGSKAFDLTIKDGKLVSEESANELTRLIGVMFDATEAEKDIGTKMGKLTLAKGVVAPVPVLGGVLSGGLTYATLRPYAERLKDRLSEQFEPGTAMTTTEE